MAYTLSTPICAGKTCHHLQKHFVINRRHSFCGIAEHLDFVFSAGVEAAGCGIERTLHLANMDTKQFVTRAHLIGQFLEA